MREKETGIQLDWIFFCRFTVGVNIFVNVSIPTDTNRMVSERQTSKLLSDGFIVTGCGWQGWWW